MDKSNYFGSGMIAKLTFSWTWLTDKSKCNGLGRLPSPSVLDLTCLPDLCYLRFDYMLSPSTLCLACLPDSHYLISLGVSKEGCAFPWVCQGRMIFPFGVTRDYSNFLKHAREDDYYCHNLFFTTQIHKKKRERNENKRRINWSWGQDNINWEF